jgi:hypothetical protein
MPVRVFETVNELANDTPEYRRGARPIVRGRISGRSGRYLRAVTAEWERQTQPVTKRRRDERHLLPAHRAKRIVGRGAAMAGEAQGGHKRIAESGDGRP